MAGSSPPQAGPLKGIFLISTASTGQGWVLDNNLPVMIAYAGYKTASGEYTYDETVDHLPLIATADHCDMIGEGTFSTRYSAWSKIGYNPDSGALEEALTYHGAAFWAATSGGAMKVRSNNNNDKSGSSGCAQVWVKYLGRDYLEYSTIVSMNGTTAVSLVDTSIARIQNFQAYTGNPPLGDITIMTSSSDVISSIGIGLTRARNSMYTVPSSKTLYIKSVYYSAASYGSGTARPTRFLLRTNYNTNQERYSTSLFFPISANLLKDNALYAAFNIPLRVPENTDLYVTVITAAASSGNVCESITRGYLVEN
jgi:hypothetical protein